jgi:tetratricopeptide (TPR) repeat protein
MNIFKTSIITVSASLLLSSCATLYINSGKKAYEDLNYQEAITLLEKGLSKKDNEEARKMLAESYMMVNDFENANKQFETISLYTSNTDQGKLRWLPAITIKLKQSSKESSAVIQRMK